MPVPDERFFFNIDCDEFVPSSVSGFATEEDRLRAFARTIGPTPAVTVVGIADASGAALPDAGGTGLFNEALSCARADAGATVLHSEGVTISLGSVVAVGGVPPAGDVTLRAVGIELTEPEPPNCGPDVSDWFIRQINAAARDSAVVAIQADLASADRLARRFGTTAQETAEAGTIAFLLREEASLGSAAPPRTSTASTQIAAGLTSATRAAAAFASGGAVGLAAGAVVARRIRAAATAWLTSCRSLRELEPHGDSSWRRSIQ